MKNKIVTALSFKATLVTIAIYGVPDSDGNQITHEAALALFDQLHQASAINREKPRHEGFSIVDVGIEGDENSGSVYAWIDCLS